MTSSSIPFRLSACAIAVLVSACGGGSATAPTAVAGSSGFAVDDYIKDATVLCDLNGNTIADSGEPTTKTDSEGFFKFNQVCSSSLVLTGGTNIDTKLPFVGMLKAPAGSTVVTPLTTLLSEGMTNDQIIAAMGLQPGTNVGAVDPARKIDGKLQQPDLFKKTLAMQQLLQKTAETLAALIPSGNASALYADVAAAMAAALRTNPSLVSGGTFSQSAIASLVQASATRLQAKLGAGVNPASLGAVMAGALKVQGDRILGAADATLTATVLSEQSSIAIRDFIVTNKSALGNAPGTETTTLGAQLTTQVTGSAPPPPPSPVAPPAGSTLLASFDEATPPAVTEFGGAGYAIGAGPAGGSGNVLKIARNGGEVYAGAWVKIPAIAANTGSRTVWARVYSPTAGVPFVAKVEWGDNAGSGNVSANETVVVGWQTLTWTFNTAAFDGTKTYDRFTILPNLDTQDTSKDYYIDSISLLAAPTPSCTTAELQCLNFSESTAGVSGFGNLVTSEIADDPVSATNKVVKLVKGVPGSLGREPWAGATVRTMRTGAGTEADKFVDTIDRVGLGTSKIVTLRSYSSAPVGTKITLKLENGIDPTKFVIAEAATTAVNSWETLSFNFANLTNGSFDPAVTYNKASILPAWTEVGGTSSLTAEATFYFDELKYSVYTATPPAPPPPPPPAPAPSTVLATFDESVSPAVNIFGGTVTELAAGPAGSGSGTGNALKITRNGGETWAGLWIPVAAIPNNAGSQTITAKVYSPHANIPFKAKAEFGDNQGTGEVSANETVVQGWQTLSWTFTNLAAPNVYNRFVLLPNVGIAGTGEVYYVDDVTLAAASGGGGSGGSALTFSSGFASNSRTIEGGAYFGASGSSQTDWSCPANSPGICGSGADVVGGSITAATSKLYQYHQYDATGAAPAGLYVNLNVFAPNVTAFSDSGDTAGLTISGKTKINFKFNPNPEWFSSATKNFLVQLEFGKRFGVGPGQSQTCRILLRQVVTPTSVDPTLYTLNLSDFAVAQPCETGNNTPALVLANGGPLSSVKIEAVGGPGAVTVGSKISGANFSVPAGNVIPTTVALTGPIYFD